MPDKVEPKDLEKVLARLTTEWQELADLLVNLGKSQDRVLEVEKILLRDASGQFRGKISADPDGSAKCPGKLLGGCCNPEVGLREALLHDEQGGDRHEAHSDSGDGQEAREKGKRHLGGAKGQRKPGPH